MIHSSNYKPWITPIYVDDLGAQIDRVQDITTTTTLNRTKVEEVGRQGIVNWRKVAPSISVSIKQEEMGNISFWQKLANKGSSVSQINITDFKTSAVDLSGYMTDDAGTFLGTIFYPNLRLDGFSLNIGDPEALIERTFTLVNEDEFIFENSNKYVITQRYVLAGSGSNQTVTVSAPAPSADPDVSGQFLLRVVRVTGGVATLLTPGVDWSYDGVSTLRINGVTSAGDIIRVWYTASSYISGQSTFVNNDIDLAAISGEAVSVYLQSSNYLYRLQSVSIDSKFTRNDIKEIGNKNTVARGVREVVNRIVLGRILEQYTIEEVLRGVAGQNYGKIDPRNYTSNLNLIVKIYSDSTKTSFKLGYKFLNLAATSQDASIPVQDYVKKGVTLECEDGFITTNQASL
jgi:hypothetical protein